MTPPPPQVIEHFDQDPDCRLFVQDGFSGRSARLYCLLNSNKGLLTLALPGMAVEFRSLTYLMQCNRLLSALRLTRAPTDPGASQKSSSYRHITNDVTEIGPSSLWPTYPANVNRIQAKNDDANVTNWQIRLAAQLERRELYYNL